MIALKDNVRFKRFTPEIVRLFPIVEEVWSIYAKDTVAVITSGNDSTHSKESYHYTDYAIDLRSKNLSEEQKELIFLKLESELDGKGYDVILEGRGTENEHFHIEYNKRQEKA